MTELESPDRNEIVERVRLLIDDRSGMIWNQDRLDEVIAEAYRDMLARLPYRVAQLCLWQSGWTEYGDRINPVVPVTPEQKPVTGVIAE